MTRTTNIFSDEEFFMIFQGSTSGTLVYYQPVVQDNHSYNLTLCLSPGNYEMALTDDYGDGWTPGSQLTMDAGTFHIGTFTLGYAVEMAIYHFQIPSQSIDYSNPTSCPSTHELLTISRTTSLDSAFESFRIYQGETVNTGTLIFAQPALANYQSHNYTLCVSGGPYVIQLLDNTGDGWLSSVTLYLGSDTLGPLAMDYGYISMAVPFDVTISNNEPTETGPTSCVAPLELVTLIRVTKSNSAEESIKIFQGNSIFGTLVYSQLNVTSDNTQYTWRVCLNTGVHVIQLLDSGNDGWTEGSSISIATNATAYGPYTISSGTSSTRSFTVATNTGETVDLSNVNYLQSSFDLKKGVAYTIPIQNDNSGINYAIFSGSLPDGMLLGSSTGMISGTPTTVTTTFPITVMIKVYTNNNYVIRTLTFVIFQDAPGCISGEKLITFSRVTKSSVHEETFNIYHGDDTNGELIFSQPYVNNNSNYTWNVCLASGHHVIELLDSYGDGWTLGSTLSLISASDMLGPYRVNTGSSQYHYFDMYVGTSSGYENINSIQYTRSNFVLQKGIGFSFYPSNDVEDVNYSIQSGALPEGISLHPTSGRLYGIPTAVTPSTVVSIKAYTSTESVTRILTFSVFENPTSCTDGKTLVTIHRVSQNYVIEESFNIYQGNANVFSQPYVIVYDEATWTVCLLGGNYSIELLDSYGDGWEPNSSVSISIDSNPVATFTLSSGNTGSFSFTVTSDITTIEYGSESFTLTKDLPVSIAPLNDAVDIYYSIQVGTLPIGLSLNGDTGVISGTPTQIVKKKTVEIKLFTSSTHYVSRALTFKVVDNPTSCSDDKELVIFNRITTMKVEEESFHIYKGEVTNVFSQPFLSSNMNYTFNACLSTGLHTLSLTDSGADGWTSGSTLSISMGASTIGPYSMTVGNEATLTFAVTPGEDKFPKSCPPDRTLVTIQRASKLSAFEEQFIIYRGDPSSDDIAFTQPLINDNCQYTWTTCLEGGDYVIHLTDNGDNGWDKEASVSLSFGTTNLGPITLLSGKETSQSFSIESTGNSLTIWITVIIIVIIIVVVICVVYFVKTNKRKQLKKIKNPSRKV